MAGRSEVISVVMAQRRNIRYARQRGRCHGGRSICRLQVKHRAIGAAPFTLSDPYFSENLTQQGHVQRPLERCSLSPRFKPSTYSMPARLGLRAALPHFSISAFGRQLGSRRPRAARSDMASRLWRPGGALTLSAHARVVSAQPMQRRPYCPVQHIRCS